MSLDLAERRKLLREALTASDEVPATDLAGVDAFAAAIDGASEEERSALVRTLPSSRLLIAEGGTPRATYLLAALGKPGHVSEELSVIGHNAAKSEGTRREDAEEALYRGLVGRSDEWLLELFGLRSSWWVRGLTWELTRRIVRERKLAPTSIEYLSALVSARSSPRDEHNLNHDRDADEIVAMLRSDEHLLAQDFWQLFRVEGMGASWYLTEPAAHAWTDAIRQLGESEPGFRDRVLDESLRALLSDFSAKNIVWYHRLHRGLTPTPDEIVARQSDYAAVLATSPSVAVSLAQDMLVQAVASPGLDVAQVIDASSSVLSRTEKKLVKTQLGLLGKLVKAHPECAGLVSAVVERAVEGLSLDLQQIARTLVVADMDADAVIPEAAEGDPVVVSGSRMTARSEPRFSLRAIADDTELFALVADQLEGVGDGAELPRILDYLQPTWTLGFLKKRRTVEIPAALAARARDVVEKTWDSNGTSPRRHLAAFLLNSALDVQGYARVVAIRDGDEPEPGMQVEEYTVSGTMTSHGVTKDLPATVHRRGTLFFPSNGPGARLADYIGNHASTRPGRKDAPRVLAPRIRDWERRLVEPGEGRYRRDYAVLGAQPRAFWLAAGEVAPRPHASFEDRILDVTGVAAEFTFRATEARDQDGCDQIVQWAAWVLRDNPATLAAHFHPALYVATQVVNVRGIGALMTALGGSHLVPEAPVYSGLALAASAKEAPHRAHAAEAIAQLADAGLLDPALFAREVTAHLSDGFVMAARVAQTFTDAASISAIAGYRVLQTLALLLPGLIGADGKIVTQGGKLVEITAALSDEYGTPVGIPAALVAKRKGSSALAIAVRALEAVVPRPTSAAEEAAARALAAREGDVA